jgi:hypothetical protein
MGESEDETEERQTRIEGLIEQLDAETAELKRLTALVGGEVLAIIRPAKQTVRKKR